MQSPFLVIATKKRLRVSFFLINTIILCYNYKRVFIEGDYYI